MPSRRSGYEKRQEVVTLNDCTAALSEEEQRPAVVKNNLMVSRPMCRSDFPAAVAGEATVEVEGRGYSA